MEPAQFQTIWKRPLEKMGKEREIIKLYSIRLVFSDCPIWGYE